MGVGWGIMGKSCEVRDSHTRPLSQATLRRMEKEEEERKKEAQRRGFFWGRSEGPPRGREEKRIRLE